MRDVTFTTPDLTTFTGLDAVGLQVVGQWLEPDRTFWPVLSSLRIVGVDAGVAWARCVIRSCGSWFMPRWVATHDVAGPVAPVPM